MNQLSRFWLKELTMRLSRSIVLAFPLLTVFLPVPGAYGLSRPTNCMIVLSESASSNLDNLRAIESSIEMCGGSVRHVFPPTVILAHIGDGVHLPLESHPMVGSVVRSELSATEADEDGPVQPCCGHRAGQ